MAKVLGAYLVTAILAGLAGTGGYVLTHPPEPPLPPATEDQLESAVTDAQSLQLLLHVMTRQPPLDADRFAEKFGPYLKSPSANVRSSAASLLANTPGADLPDREALILRAFRSETNPRALSSFMFSLVKFDPKNSTVIDEEARRRASAGDGALQALLDQERPVLDRLLENQKKIDEFQRSQQP